MFKLRIDNKEVEASPGETILQVAHRKSIDIPTLCHSDLLEPAAMCRICTVEMSDGRRTKLVTACNFPVREGLDIQTNSERVRKGRRMVLELLLARCPGSKVIREMAREYGIDAPRFSEEDLDCIVCGLCVRACEQYGSKSLCLSGRSDKIHVETPFCSPSADCTGCGICAAVCPAGKIEVRDEDGERLVVHDGQVFGKVKLRACSRCGDALQTEALAEMVKKRMGPGYVPAHLDLCSECARRTVAEEMVQSWDLC